MNADKLVVGLAGMPGSGKSLVVETAKQLGYAIVTMGDVIRQETLNRGLDLTPQNVGKVMLQLRQEGGNCVIAEKCVAKIEEQTSRKILIDGLRSLYEADTFKAHFAQFVLVAVYTSPEIRYNRLHSRGRSDDPPNWEVFHERDLRELGVGLGSTIAMAQVMLINDGGVEQFKVQARECLRGIEEKWLK